MLKISCFKQNRVSQVWLKVVPCNFLLNTGESHVVLTSLTHIDSGLQQNLIFQIFSRWKVLKMLKRNCFNQNQCISGMTQGIPMQFFAQHWWKSCCCDQFHRYSQWFAVKFIFLNFSIAGKCSKCLKYAVLSCFKQNYCISGMHQVIPKQCFAQQWWKSCCCDQFLTYSQWFTAKFNFSNFQ